MAETRNIIFLIVHSNAGKSTLGKSLSKELGLPRFSIGDFSNLCAKKEGFNDVVDLFRKEGTVHSWNRLIPRFMERIDSLISPKASLQP